MTPKPDLEGLTYMYMQLGQMDSALKSHIEDAEEREDGVMAFDLKEAGASIRQAQEFIRRVTSKLIEELRP